MAWSLRWRRGPELLAVWRVGQAWVRYRWRWRMKFWCWKPRDWFVSEWSVHTE